MRIKNILEIWRDKCNFISRIIIFWLTILSNGPFGIRVRVLEMVVLILLVSGFRLWERLSSPEDDDIHDND